MQTSCVLAIANGLSPLVSDQPQQSVDFTLITQVHGGGKLHLRSTDSKYLDLVDQWWSVLLPRIVPYLYQIGGPILMVQASILPDTLSAGFFWLHARLPARVSACVVNAARSVGAQDKL